MVNTIFLFFSLKGFLFQLAQVEFENLLLINQNKDEIVIFYSKVPEKEETNFVAAFKDKEYCLFWTGDVIVTDKDISDALEKGFVLSSLD